MTAVFWQSFLSFKEFSYGRCNICLRLVVLIFAFRLIVTVPELVVLWLVPYPLTLTILMVRAPPILLVIYSFGLCLATLRHFQHPISIKILVVLLVFIIIIATPLTITIGVLILLGLLGLLGVIFL